MRLCSCFWSDLRSLGNMKSSIEKSQLSSEMSEHCRILYFIANQLVGDNVRRMCRKGARNSFSVRLCRYCMREGV